jgi:hypothetical protein
MKRTTTFYRLSLILLVVFAVTGSVVWAQERIALDAFYNSPEGFHVFIPTGWENLSTDAYAHFSNPEADIYAVAVPTEDVQAGIQQAMELILPDFDGEPSHVSEVILSNGTWTQQIYPTNDTQYLTAYGQVYTGSTYVMLWHSVQPVQPVIVSEEDVQAGMTSALATLGYEVEEPASSEEITINDQTLTQNVYEGTPPITATGRVRGETTLVMVTTAESEVNPLIFFTMLTDFFITPATTPYLYLGLVATAVISLAFIGTLVVRQRNLQKDLQTLETLQAEGQTKV